MIVCICYPLRSISQHALFDSCWRWLDLSCPHGDDLHYTAAMRATRRTGTVAPAAAASGFCHAAGRSSMHRKSAPDTPAPCCHCRQTCNPPPNPLESLPARANLPCACRRAIWRGTASKGDQLLAGGFEQQGVGNALLAPEQSPQLSWLIGIEAQPTAALIHITAEQQLLDG